MELSPWKRRIVSFAAPALLMVLSLLLFGFDYTVNDDVTMVAILNGSYTGTPNAHAIFIKYPLSWFIAACYSIAPAISWYRVILLGICVAAMAFLLCQLLCCFPRHPLLTSLMLTGAVALLWCTQFVVFTFSTCGAFVSAAASLSYALIPREQDLKPGKLLPLLVLFWLSYCIRSQFAYTGLLLLGIVWLYKYHSQMFKDPRCWLIPLAGVVGLGVCIGCNELAYSSEDWETFLDYNSKRSYLQDYVGTPSYKKHTELYESLGITKEERDSISNYRYLLADSFGPEDFEAIYDYTVANEKPKPFWKEVKSTIKAAIKHYLLLDEESVGPLQVASLALPFLLMGAAVILSVRRQRHVWIFPLILMIGVACMWFYICYHGRYPPRVAFSLRILTVTSCLIGLAFLYTDLPFELPEAPIAHRTARASFLVAGALMLAVGLGYTWTAEGRTTPPPRSDFYVYLDAHPENVYIRDTQLTMFDTEEYPSVNAVSTGGWLHYSPLYYEKLEYLGLERDLHRSVLLEPNVYLLTSANPDRVHKVLGVSNETELEFEIVEELGSAYVYQFTSIG